MIKKLSWVACLILCGCHAAKNLASKEPGIKTVEEREGATKNYVFAQGIPAFQDSRFEYKRQGEKILSVQLQEPVVVSVATKPEKWGYFQFPTIMRRSDGSIAVKWHLNQDAIEAYGSHQFGSAVSPDGGQTWKAVEVNDPTGYVVVPNGDKINILTPKPIKVEELQLPKPVGYGMDTYAKTPYIYYKLQDLPESRQGVFMSRLKKGASEWQEERAKLTDPQAARYSFRGLFPVVWWGDIHVAKDQSLIAGIYPGFYIDEQGKADTQMGAFFYRSTDMGHSWNIQGRIRYVSDPARDTAATRRMGFTEPAYEILPDGSFICVLRTTDGQGIGPMYVSRSTDQGKTWTQPAVFTPSGVLPQLLRLDNGVTVLASGRPGVQLRFTTDANGEHWSDPFEMLPYTEKNDQVSCGYTGLLATGPDRFIIVYSDFKYLNEAKEERKAIKVREVIVTPK